MKSNIFIFFNYQTNPSTIFEMKKEAMKARKFNIQFRGYYDMGWAPFLSGFKTTYVDKLVEASVALPDDFMGIIAMYDDDLLQKKNLITTDVDQILAIIKE